MSSWLSDFRYAYRKHPLGAVGVLATLILAFCFVSVAFAIHYGPHGVVGPASTTVTQPAQGQASERAGSNGRRPAPSHSPSTSAGLLPAIAPVSTRTADPSAGSIRTARPSAKPSRATPSTVQSPSASTVPPTPSASPTTQPPTTPTDTGPPASPSDSATPSTEPT